MFRSIGTKERLVDKVVNEIQRQIFEGGLRPGTLLPSERERVNNLSAGQPYAGGADVVTGAPT
jgi:DNA-binding FadR family transcriptional regulator